MPDFSAGAAAVRAERTSRGFLLPRFSGITPRQVDWALRGYDEGEFRACAPLMEAVARYDAQIAACIEERYSMTAGADWEIQTEQDADESVRALAETQSAVLRDFFNTFSVSSALAQDERQGISALVRHVISAVGYGYSAAALTWFPAKTPAGALTQHCEALTCPLRFFEARERRLRIRADYAEFSGEPLAGDHWLVAHAQGTPLLLPTLFAYMFKSTPIEDWAHTVEKFGIPFVTAKTPAQYKSEEWLAAEEALRSVGSGFSGVFGKDVELEVHALAQGDAPHAAIVDYIDRSVSRLWLGGDLATMSQTGAGAVGSQSQLGSEAFLRKTDRAFVEQVVDFGLVRPLLRRVFGAGARQLAYFKFKDAEAKDVAASIQRLKTAREMRLPIAKAFAYAELGVAQPQPWEELVDEPEAPADDGGGNGEKFRTEDKKKDDEEKETDYSNDGAASGKRAEAFARAVSAQFDELLGRLRALERTESEEAFLNALRELETDFPEMERRILTRNDVAETIAETIIAQIETESGNDAADFRNVIDKNGMNHDGRGRFAPKNTTGAPFYEQGRRGTAGREQDDLAAIQRRYQEEIAGESFSGIRGDENEALRARLRELIERRRADGERSGLFYGNGFLVNGYHVYETNDAEMFHAAFSAAKPKIENGELVDLHSVEDYKKCKLYLSDDGLQGIAVEKSGNIISVYNTESSYRRGWLGAVKHITDNTPNAHLDCYDSPKQPLRGIYEKKLGFKVAATMDYNMAFDHDGIAENHGKPKIAFIVKTVRPVQARRFGKDDYAAAVAWQKKNLQKKDES